MVRVKIKLDGAEGGGLLRRVGQGMPLDSLDAMADEVLQHCDFSKMRASAGVDINGAEPPKLPVNCQCSCSTASTA